MDEPGEASVTPSAPAAATALPLPPDHLRFLVAGTTDEPWFLEGGRRGFECLKKLLASHGVALHSLTGVLDFGCGCGRVLRHWLGSGVAGLQGCDYNPDLIAWCRQELAFARTFVNQLAPPLDLPDASLDLAYAFSVFTHLDEAMQFAWMREMGRILRPKGLLVMTTHGASYANELSARQEQLFASGTLVVRHTEQAGTNTCGAFHPELFMREVQAPAGGFTVVEFISEGAKGNPHQDLYVLRRLGSDEGFDHFRAAGRLFSEWFLASRDRGDRDFPAESELAELQRRLAEQERYLAAVRGSKVWRAAQAFRALFGRRW